MASAGNYTEVSQHKYQGKLVSTQSVPGMEKLGRIHHLWVTSPLDWHPTDIIIVTNVILKKIKISYSSTSNIVCILDGVPLSAEAPVRPRPAPRPVRVTHDWVFML